MGYYNLLFTLGCGMWVVARFFFFFFADAGLHNFSLEVLFICRLTHGLYLIQLDSSLTISLFMICLNLNLLHL